MFNVDLYRLFNNKEKITAKIYEKTEQVLLTGMCDMLDQFESNLKTAWTCTKQLGQTLEKNTFKSDASTLKSPARLFNTHLTNRPTQSSHLSPGSGS